MELDPTCRGLLDADGVKVLMAAVGTDLEEEESQVSASVTVHQHSYKYLSILRILFDMRCAMMCDMRQELLEKYNTSGTGSLNFKEFLVMMKDWQTQVIIEITSLKFSHLIPPRLQILVLGFYPFSSGRVGRSS